MLSKVKMALRVTTTAYDSEINLLIAAALLDLGLTDIGEEHLTEAMADALVIQAVTTYCKMHFGEPDEYDRLKASYDEQKAQLSMSSKYTTWSE